MIVDNTFREKLRAFNEAMANQPTAEEVRQHSFLKVDRIGADGKKEKVPYEYIPIEITEAKLDHYFNGLWQTYSFKYQVIVNELVGDLELAVYHPEAGVWLRRSGTGAVVIQQHVEWETDPTTGKKFKKENDFLDINRKIANTLGKDMGHLKSECIKNAAKSFGRTMGRDTGRDISDSSYQDAVLSPELVEMEISDIDTKVELNLYYETLPQAARSDKRIRMLLKDKELMIKAAARTQKGGVNANT